MRGDARVGAEETSGHVRDARVRTFSGTFAKTGA
jgi:hypothetical protein